MSTRTALKGRIGAIASSVVLVALVGGGVGAYAMAPKDEAPAAVVETVEPTDLTAIPYTNGLAEESEEYSAAVEAARIEAERVEAERVAAEAAAAAAEAARIEAERVAAEQAAAQEEADRIARQQSRQQSNNNTGGDTGGEEQPGHFGNGTRAPWVDLGNGTGMWDFSNCPTQSGTTGSDGNVYCE